MTCVSFPIILSLPPFLERNPTCLASLPSNSRQLALLLPQHWSRLVIRCSPGWQPKSFYASHNSFRDRVRVGTASFMNSSSSSSPVSSYLSSSSCSLMTALLQSCLSCLHLSPAPSWKGLLHPLQNEPTFASNTSSCVQGGYWLIKQG